MSQQRVDQLIATCGRPVAGHLLTQAQLTRATHEDRVLEIRLSSTPVGDAASIAFTRSWALTRAGEILPAYLVFPRPIPPQLRRESGPSWQAVESVFAAFGVDTRPVPLHQRYPALVTAVVAARDDDAPRRVLADALLEAGDARGELIALQLKGDSPELEHRLLTDHGARWRAELGLESSACEFRRGFIEQVTVAGEAEPLAAAWSHTPIRRLVLVSDDALEAVLPLELARLEGLAVEGCAVSAKLAMRLAMHPAADGVRRLSFIAVSGLSECVLPLASGRWPKLERLVIARCGLSATELDVLGQRFGAALQHSAV